MDDSKKHEAYLEGYRSARAIIEGLGMGYAVAMYQKKAREVRLHLQTGAHANPALHYMRQVERYVAELLRATNAKGYVTAREVREYIEGWG